MIELKNIKFTQGDESQPASPEPKGEPSENGTPAQATDEKKEQDSGTEGEKNFDKYVPQVSDVPVAQRSGFKDEYIEGLVTTLIEKYEKGEDIKQVLQMASADYSTVADEEIIRMDIEQSNPGLSKSAIEKLVNKKLNSIYSVDDEDDEDEMSIRNQLVKQEADRIRQKKAEEQSSYFKTTKLSPEEIQKQEQEAIRQQVEQWTDMVYSDPELSQVLKTGKMTLGNADNQFAYEVKPDEMVKAMVVPGHFENLFKAGENQMDLKKWARVVAFALDPDAYDRFLLSSGKTIGTGNVLDRLENPSKGSPKQSPTQGSMVQALKDALKAKM